MRKGTRHHGWIMLTTLTIPYPLPNPSTFSYPSTLHNPCYHIQSSYITRPSTLYCADFCIIEAQRPVWVDMKAGSAHLVDIYSLKTQEVGTEEQERFVDPQATLLEDSGDDYVF